MTPALPRVTAKQIITVIEKHGFVLARQSGSHKIYRNGAGLRVTVPFHAAKVLHPKTLKSILREADIDPKNLRDLL
jgi:predicted RNA binding protein YcfA (HicA-like mRNA interferase family)